MHIKPSTSPSSSAGRAAAPLLLGLAVAAAAVLVFFALRPSEPRKDTTPIELDGATGQTTEPRDTTPPGTGRETRTTEVARTFTDPTAHQAALPPLGEFPGGIDGQVVDAWDKPIEGARIALHLDTGELVASARSDAQGRFELDLPPVEDPQYLWVTHESYGPSLMQGFETVAGVDLPLGRIVLHEGATISGTVRDEEAGRTVAGAILRPYTNVEGELIALPDLAARTDARGRYELANLPAGPVRFWVLSETHAPLLSEVQVLGPGMDVGDFDVVLPRSDALTGRVLDASGNPVRDAVLTVRPIPVPEAFSLETQSNENGTWSLSPLPVDHSLILTCKHPAYLAQERTIGNEQRDVTITLAPAATLRIELLPGESAGPISHEPHLYVERGGGTDEARAPETFQILAASQATFRYVGEGAFEGESLHDGWYRFRAVWGPRHSAISEPLHLRAGTAHDPVRIALETTTGIEGTVLGPDLEPLPEAQVRIALQSLQETLITDAQGRFETAAFAGEGAILVTIEKLGLAPFEDVVSVGRSWVEGRFQMNGGGRIHGLVTIAGTRPERPVTVWLRSDMEDVQRTVLTDDEGRYDFRGLPLDEGYQLFPLAHSPQNGSAVSHYVHPVEDDDRFQFDEAYEFLVDLDAEDPEVELDIDLPLQKPAILKGVVRDANGPRAGLVLEASVFENGLELRDTTRADGTFEIRIPGGGEIDLDVLGREGRTVLYQTTETVAAGATQEFDIALRIGRLSGQILDPTSKAVAGAQVRLVYRGPVAGGLDTPVGLASQTETNAGGAFRFDEVPEGVYRLEAWGPKLALTAKEPITVAHDVATEDVTLHLDHAAPFTMPVVDQDGRPMSRAQVEVFDAQGARVLHESGRFAIVRGGRLSIERLPAGTYRLVLRIGSQRAQQDVTIFAQTENTLPTWQLPFSDPSRRTPR